MRQQASSTQQRCEEPAVASVLLMRVGYLGRVAAAAGNPRALSATGER